MIWMLHLSSYSHSCLLVPRASFYSSILTLAALEDAYTAYICMTSWTETLPLNILYNCHLLWRLPDTTKWCVNIEVADKSCPKNYVGTYIYIFSFIAECAQYITNSHGMIRSPGYPITIYQNIDCTWLIHFQDGKSIKLEIMDIFIEPGCLTKNPWSRWEM